MLWKIVTQFLKIAETFFKDAASVYFEFSIEMDVAPRILEVSLKKCVPKRQSPAFRQVCRLWCIYFRRFANIYVPEKKPEISVKSSDV